MYNIYKYVYIYIYIYIYIIYIYIQAHRNEKNSGELPILKYCRPPWLADKESFTFQIV